MRRLILGALLAGVVLPAAAAVAQPCVLSWWIDDDQRVWLHHDMDANCAVFDFDHTVTFGTGTIDVEERALLEAWAVCVCPYATDVVVAGLAPGDYQVHWRWGEVDVSVPDPEIWWVDCAFTLTVPAAAVRPEPHLVGTQAAGCGVAYTDVPEEPAALPIPWGAIKSLYR